MRQHPDACQHATLRVPVQRPEQQVGQPRVLLGRDESGGVPQRGRHGEVERQVTDISINNS